MDRRAALALLGAVGLSACAVGPTFDAAKTSDLVAADYKAADKLIAGSQRPIARNVPIIVATLVRLDDLGESSNLGRLVSEHIAARLTQLGYTVPEMKLRGSIFVRSDQGELLLSRDVRQIAATHRAQAVVVGTYAIAQDYVYINVELVDATSAHTISAYDYLLPLVAQVRVLAGLKPYPS